MFYRVIDSLNNNGFALIKWALSAASGLLTTGLILMLEI